MSRTLFPSPRLVFSLLPVLFLGATVACESPEDGLSPLEDTTNRQEAIVNGIVDGVTTSTVRIEVRYTPNTSQAEVCTGVVLSPSWVLTSAQCVARLNNPTTTELSLVKVIRKTGTSSLGGSTGGETFTGISALQIHPGYKPASSTPPAASDLAANGVHRGHDWALLKLATPQTTWTTTPLVSRAEFATLVSGVSTATITGFGGTAFNNSGGNIPRRSGSLVYAGQPSSGSPFARFKSPAVNPTQVPVSGLNNGQATRSDLGAPITVLAGGVRKLLATVSVREYVGAALMGTMYTKGPITFADDPWIQRVMNNVDTCRGTTRLPCGGGCVKVPICQIAECGSYWDGCITVNCGTCPGSMTCDEGKCCPPGGCGEDEQPCTPGEVRCDGTRRQKCDTTGSWDTLENCLGATPYCIVLPSSDETVCDPNPPCEPGTERCSGNLVQTCNDQGLWRTATTCSGATPYCVDPPWSPPFCNPTDDPCEPGTARCFENDYQVCTDQKTWTTTQDCGTSLYCSLTVVPGMPANQNHCSIDPPYPATCNGDGTLRKYTPTGWQNFVCGVFFTGPYGASVQSEGCYDPPGSAPAYCRHFCFGAPATCSDPDWPCKSTGCPPEGGIDNCGNYCPPPNPCPPWDPFCLDTPQQW